MPEIKSKHVLKEKGEVANLPTITQLKTDMSWTDPVDLDLMAFYETKDGTIGGVFSDNLGGSLGDLNSFPFMKLSGDAGVGATGGDSIESMTIAKMEDINKIYLVALNYTDALNKNDSASFSNYGAKINIIDSNGEAIEIPLNSPDVGTAALIATIDNSSPIGATVTMNNEVMSFSSFIEKVPGAVALTK